MIAGQIVSIDSTHLILNYAEITDLIPLQRLKQLTWLELEGTEISDLALLQSLTNLKELIAHGCTELSRLPSK